jgi:hypothetical protein
MNKITLIKIALVAITLGGLVLFTMTSCRTGYGCHGNQSWNKMVERNNQP